MESDASLYESLDASSKAFVSRVLAAARDYVGARVSFLAELVGPDKFIRAAEGEAEASGLPVGMRFPIEDSYCYQLLSGRIPEAIYDAATNPVSCDIPLTRVLGIESYMGVPVLLGDGRPFGTLCCVNFEPNPEACGRDVAFMRFLADLVARQLDSQVQATQQQIQRRARMQAILAAGGPTMVFHPIVEMRTRRIVGVEALARWDGVGAPLPPDELFRQAWEVGMGPRMELAALDNALWALECLPEDVYLSVNVSPATIVLPGFMGHLAHVRGHRLVLELTEHAAVSGYEELGDALQRVRANGVRVAIDDVGAGYSSLRHVLRIAPDLIKLDMSLVDAIDTDIAKQAMVAGVLAFAQKTHTAVVAEGVESDAQRAALEEAGVRHGQGFLFAMPGPLAPLMEQV